MMKTKTKLKLKITGKLKLKINQNENHTAKVTVFRCPVTLDYSFLASGMQKFSNPAGTPINGNPALYNCTCTKAINFYAAIMH